jgi:hypothetical protein
MTPTQIILARSCYTESAQLTALLALAESKTSTNYGANRNEAVALLVLHWLALKERGVNAAAGPIVSESEGDLSVTYAQPAQSPSGTAGDDLSSTSWGTELLRLRKGSFIAGGLTRLG